MTGRVKNRRSWKNHGDGNDLEEIDNPTIGDRCKAGALFKGNSIDDYHL
jgi:hypothetical protein